VKRLNESSAKELVQESVSKQLFKIPLSPYLSLLGPTMKDRSAPTGRTIEDSIFRHLIKQGLVSQKVDIIQYPVISGVFSGRRDEGSTFDKREFNLEMVPNSNSLVGEATEIHQYWANPARHNVTGAVEPDGTVTLSDPSVGIRAVYKEQGAIAHLERMECQDTSYYGPCSFIGKASGRKVDIKWYTYSWSPEFQQKIVQIGDDSAVKGGRIEIGEVSNLRLVTETEATAQVTYTAVLDNVGQCFYPAGPPKGQWRVLFGKKPDGTWFVDKLG
jgi:hypothetical protein